MDDQLFLPKSYIKFELRNPIAYKDTNHINMKNIFVMLLCDSLIKHSYSAGLAGLYYLISSSDYGINVFLSGISENMSSLLEIIFFTMINFEVDEKRFENIKDTVYYLPLLSRVTAYSTKKWLDL